MNRPLLPNLQAAATYFTLMFLFLGNLAAAAASLADGAFSDAVLHAGGAVTAILCTYITFPR